MKRLIVSLIVPLFFATLSAQDIIYLNDGSEIKAIVTEITLETVKYKKHNQNNGPIRNISVSDVFMIIYQDGTREVFKAKSSQPISKVTNDEIEVKVTAKSSIGYEIIDKRENPLVMGYLYSSSLGYIPKKIKDKKGLLFPEIKEYFKEGLDEKGLTDNGSISNNNYLLEVSIKKVEHNMYDQFVKMKWVYVLEVNVLLINLENNKPIHNNKFSTIRECSRKKCKKTTFRIEVNKIIEQIINDREFSKFINN